jgi:hypothetical protein
MTKVRMIEDKTGQRAGFIAALVVAAGAGALIVGAAGLWLARGNAIMLDLAMGLRSIFCL